MDAASPSVFLLAVLALPCGVVGVVVAVVTAIEEVDAARRCAADPAGPGRYESAGVAGVVAIAFLMLVAAALQVLFAAAGPAGLVP